MIIILDAIYIYKHVFPDLKSVVLCVFFLLDCLFYLIHGVFLYSTLSTLKAKCYYEEHCLINLGNCNKSLTKHHPKLGNFVCIYECASNMKAYMLSAC